MSSPPDRVAFRLLGPVEVVIGAEPVRFARAQHRDLLAFFLLHAGKLVGVDRIVDAMWGPAPPATATTQVMNMVSSLRAALLPAGPDGPDTGGVGRAADVVLERQAGGYLLRTGSARSDLEVFTRLREQARAAADPEQKVNLLRQALALWSGEPLGNVRAPYAGSVRADLCSRRSAMLEALFDAELRRGRAAEVVEEMAAAVREDPYREPLIIQLMLALYRAGRRVEALQTYRDATRALADEHGLEPSPVLRELESRMLREDPALGGGPGLAGLAPAADLTAPAPRVPAQLPLAVPGFTGRARELSALDDLLDGAPPGTVVISAVSGTAGVGKTALAVHWGHRMTGRFPDGQLYLDLHGYDVDQPRAPLDMLASLLRALGVPANEIPPGVAERAALYRTTMSGRQMLILLDNAADAEQVRPLLPSTPGCLVVVTSRDSLAGLVVRDGARRLDLDLLPVADAVALLRTLLGDRVNAEPDAATVLVDRCARLPLALRVVAELAVGRPDVSLAELAGELADERHRLDAFDCGEDPRAAVRATFSWSYHRLPPLAARLFRLLGWQPGEDASAAVCAALLDVDESQARALAGRLVRASLINEPAPGRYTMHDLLRHYARDLARAEPAAERDEACGRLVEYYRVHAIAANSALFPQAPAAPAVAAGTTGAVAAARPAPATAGTLPVRTPAGARSWLDSERANLVAAVRHAVDRGWHRCVADLARAVFWYLDTSGYYDEGTVVHGLALRAARSRHDRGHARSDEADALRHLAVAHMRQGRLGEALSDNQQALEILDELSDAARAADALKNMSVIHGFMSDPAGALEYARRAVTLFRATGDILGEGRALGSVGVNYAMLGRYPEALEHFQQALRLHRQAGDVTGEALTLVNIGEINARRGRYDEAIDADLAALALFEETGNRNGVGGTLRHLGDVYLRRAMHPEAVTHYERALALARELGDRGGEAAALDGLGLAHRQSGHIDQAAKYHRAALAKAREIGETGREASALNGLAETAATADADGAAALHRQALDLAVAIGDRHEQARALDGLATLAHAAGDPTTAHRNWREALDLYEDLDAPEAQEIRERLADLPRIITDRAGA